MPASLPNSLEEFSDLSFDELNQLTGATAFIRARAFNPHLTTDLDQFEDCLEALARRVEDTEGRKRTRSKEDAAAFRAAISALVLDLYSAWKADPELQVGVSLDSNDYGKAKRTRYSNQRFTSRQFLAAFNGLERLGLLKVVKRGYHDKKSGAGANTKITASSSLVSCLEREATLSQYDLFHDDLSERLILRAPKAQYRITLDYRDTADLMLMRINLNIVNTEIPSTYY